MKVEKRDDMAVRELRGYIGNESLFLKDNDGKAVVLRDGGKISVGVRRSQSAFSDLNLTDATEDRRLYAGDTITITLTL